MSDVRDVLRLDDHALAQALWDRDWGGVLGLMPPVPDVPRTTVLDEIASFLSPFRPAGRNGRPVRAHRLVWHRQVEHGRQVHGRIPGRLQHGVLVRRLERTVHARRGFP